jgi:gliding motility-associated-like protein
MKSKLKYLSIILSSFCFQYHCIAQDFIWAKSLEGRGISSPINLSPGTSNVEAITVDSIGNIYIAGYSNDTVDFDPGPNEVLLDAGNDDIYLAKYDSQGNYLWAHVFWSPGWNYAKHIKIDKNGDVIIAGSAYSYADFDPGIGTSFLGNNATANYIFIAKYDANGNYIWAKEMGSSYGSFIGSLDIDYNNNIFITGHFYESIDMDPSIGAAYLQSNQTGIFTAKYNQNGNYIWANCISGIGNLGESFSIKCSKSGYVYVAGIFGNTVDFDPGTNVSNISANTTCDRFFLKYNNYGNLIWVRSFDVNEDGGLFSDRMIKIALDEDENVYLTGNFRGLVDFNPGSGVFNIDAALTTASYICKYTTTGHFLWAKGLIGSLVQTTDITLDCQNNICLAGSFARADFDPSPAFFMLQSSAPSAANNFYAKYSNEGDFIWVKQIGNNGYGGSTLSACIALSQGFLYVAGGFKQTGNFDPDGIAELQAKGVGQNSFFAKYAYVNYQDKLQDTTLCSGQNLLLDVSTTQGSYLWHNQSNQPTYLVTEAGKYWVEITTENCKTMDTIAVSYTYLKPLNFSDTVICEGTNLLLNSNNDNAQYLWQDNSTASSLEVNQEGVYWVKVTENNCSISDTVTIETKTCETFIAYPNVFTPNTDGLNEHFVPIKIKGIKDANLVIFSRWGQKVFETTNLLEGWNGKINNSLANTGVYYWILNYKDINQTELYLKGFVTLLN